MDPAQRFRPASLESLLVELLRMILSSLTDVISLRNALFSCPLLYSAFSESDETISSCVLLHQIGCSVIPEATVAFQSAALRPHDQDPKNKQSIIAFMIQSLSHRSDLKRKWALKDAILIGRAHIYVAALAKRFSQLSLAKRPMHQTKPIATHAEQCRIERALYRFEIYCNVFRESADTASVVSQERKSLFFDHFAPWEIEQIGCIHDFLVWLISPAFNDIAEHDVRWGVAGVQYADQVDNDFIQHIISQGLGHIHRIALAETYDQRYDLLYTDAFPQSSFDFLCEGLRTAIDQGGATALMDMSLEDQARDIRKPFFADPDPGPEEAWRWAHQEETWSYWIYQQDRSKEREWGYVMWDHERLEQAGIFQKPWEEPDAEEELGAGQEKQRQQAYLQNSQDQREWVSRRGGSGWWSWGDESKIQWTEDSAPQMPGHPLSDSRPFFRPESLEEAREGLKMMILPS